MKILIIEDFRLVALMLQRALKGMGYPSVFIAQSTEEAVSLLTHHRFDLLIIDWMLPGVSGVSLIKQLRSWKHYAHTPMLMVTGNDRYENVMEALQAGATDYLVKPIKPLRLAEKLKNLLPPPPTIQSEQ